MSEFVAVGPARNLDGPLPLERPHSLLKTLEAMGGGNVIRSGNEWLNGVNVWGYPKETPSLWEPCSDGTFREKESESTWDQPRFDSLVAYLPIQCSSITASPEVFSERAEQALDATLSFAVEEALAKGVAGSTNPFFGDANLDVVGGATNLPTASLAFLENAIGATGRGGMIHATPGTIAAWGFDLLETNGVIRTPNGTPVVSGAGYIDTDPAGETGSTPASGLEWAFATGPIQVYISGGPDFQVSEFVDRENNVITYRAEKFILPLWDTSLQAGVLVDWTP